MGRRRLRRYGTQLPRIAVAAAACVVVVVDVVVVVVGGGGGDGGGDGGGGVGVGLFRRLLLSPGSSLPAPRSSRLRTRDGPFGDKIVGWGGARELEEFVGGRIRATVLGFVARREEIPSNTGTGSVSLTVPQNGALAKKNR